MATTSQSVILRQRIQITGIVQGVGFRPFIFNLAKQSGINGFVLNTSSGVTIEAEGEAGVLQSFVTSIRMKAPPLATIESVSIEDAPIAGSKGFEIRESRSAPGAFVLVSPDTSTCDDCWHDVMDPEDRRYGYPFTNCTNCGPRYTIIRDIPYDRPSTTMASFRMCPQCEAEYHDPSNRRFHAQPNACPACGPTLALVRSGSFEPGPGAYGFGDISVSVMRDVRRLLKQGAIIAIKGLGGFQLACDAENDEAVRRLRQRKKRSDKPFALMTRDTLTAEFCCEISQSDRDLLLSRERPIVIMRRRAGCAISSTVAPGNSTLGIMLPYTPLHGLLFGEQTEAPPAFNALVMTSGNISDEPIVTSNQDAWRQLSSVADWFLFHNRDIYMRVDDSVARTFEGSRQVLRRSRGYAPYPIELGQSVPELLACGAELKNTLCLTKDRYAILSQHIGDVDNYETLEFFRETLANLKKLFRVEPTAVAHDLHPLYLTTRFALELPCRKIAVQHHHAHLASCMAENHLTGKVIGVAFDGTGYGSDGQIWGGEFLLADFGGFQRRAHFRYVPLAGGDAAVRQPWRSALSWLKAAFGSDLPLDLPVFGEVRERDLAAVSRMIDRNLNTVLTSSCGRVFDAVASIVGIRQEVTFEGQAAIELEMAARADVDESYPFEISERQPALIDLRPVIREIVHDMREAQSREKIASRFHNTIAEVTAEVCRRIRVTDGQNRVCLSGGTFQNLRLLERTVALLRQSGFEVFLHSKVPPNDGGIALGQAAVAAQILTSGA